MTIKAKITHADLQRDVGRMEAEIAALKTEVAEMRADVRIIRDTLSQARGGWKTLMLVGGLAGAVGAAMAKLAPLLVVK